MYSIVRMIDEFDQNFYDPVKPRKKIKLEKVSYRESYIVGTIAIAFAASYSDDHIIDEDEMAMIDEILNRYRNNISESAKRNIDKVLKYSYDFNKLIKVFDRLKLDDIMIIRVINDMESRIKISKKDNEKQLKFLDQLKAYYRMEGII